MLKKLKYLIIPALMFSPLIVAAQQTSRGWSGIGINKLISEAQALLDRLVPLLIGLALLLFLWGVFRFMLARGGSEDERKEGRQFMLWGLIALFVMVSVWGLVGILGETILGGTPNPSAPTTPRLPGRP